MASDLADGSEAAAIVAAAIAEVAGTRAGWGPPWRELLGRLRRHESPWVQGHALDTRIATE